MVEISPLALIDPEEGPSDSQAGSGEGAVAQFNGQAQLPVPAKVTFCADGAVPP